MRIIYSSLAAKLMIVAMVIFGAACVGTGQCNYNVPQPYTTYILHDPDNPTHQVHATSNANRVVRVPCGYAVD